MNASRHYDLLTIGGGSGGIAAAIRAARHGARCALIAGSRLGGTCVNLGCIPKKILWHAADIAAATRDAADYGFGVTSPKLDWDALKTARDGYIDRLVEVYRRNLAQAGVEVIEGVAAFRDRRTLTVAGADYSADHIVIATGGRPVVPEVPGAGLGITSDDFFGLTRQPRAIAIVGSGYISAEFATMLRLLGSEVKVLVRRQHVLSHFDVTLREALMEEMRKDGIEIITEADVAALERGPNASLVAVCADGRRISGFETLLWAVGRISNLEQLGLAAVGLEGDAHGHLSTDAFQNTHVPGIYAVGDVTGRAAMTPVAIAAGRRLADRLFGGGSADARLDYGNIPTVVFSHPPVAVVGLTEGQARDRYGDAIQVYIRRFTPLYHGLIRHKVRAMVKMITAGRDEKIVGCHIMGPRAEEMLQGFAVAIRMGATKRDFDDTVAIHPTGAEEVLNLG
jgi:glutathione reductase (NADPH)